MTSRAHPLFVAAIMMLAACGGKATNANAADNIAAENAAAPANEAAATPQPASASPGGLAADYMVGKWSAVAEDCANTIEFRKDGTVTTPIGEAKWAVSGEKLSIAYPDGSEPTVSSVNVLDPNRIELTHASGTKETEKRC